MLGPIPIYLQDHPFGTPSFGRMDHEYGYTGAGIPQPKKKTTWVF